MSTSLLINRSGRLATLTLNRPEKRNALNLELCRSLVCAIRQAQEDEGVGAVLLDAIGPSFCAGMDLGEVLEAQQDEMVAVHVELFSMGARLRKPIVAAVQGPVMAGGLGLAVNAHVVMAASDAKFGLTERRIGLWPYTVFRAVANAVGERKATELALTARVFGATEALHLGIVDLVADPADLKYRARDLALELSLASNSALAGGLEFIHRIRSMDESGTERLAGECRAKAQNSADFREGVMAFREKRQPAWPSHRG